MAKKKFNKEERLAIIRKLKNIATKRTNESWEKHRAKYKPSELYLKVQLLLEQRNSACEKLKELAPGEFTYYTYDPVNIENRLNSIRDSEIRHLIERYEVNETDLEVEIILMDQDKPIDDLIERLLRNCLCK